MSSWITEVSKQTRSPQSGVERYITRAGEGSDQVTTHAYMSFLTEWLTCEGQAFLCYDVIYISNFLNNMVPKKVVIAMK